MSIHIFLLILLSTTFFYIFFPAIKKRDALSVNCTVILNGLSSSGKSQAINYVQRKIDALSKLIEADHQNLPNPPVNRATSPFPDITNVDVDRVSRIDLKYNRRVSHKVKIHFPSL